VFLSCISVQLGVFSGYPENTLESDTPRVLTDRAIRTSKPREKPYELYDSGGLHVLVQPSGSKLWPLEYRFAGREKLISFGSYADVTLATAREKRD
jgi:Arm DNA-binding domain